MQKWIVTTRAEVRRIYEVEAADQKEAIAKTTLMTSQHEEDVEEETLAVQAAE